MVDESGASVASSASSASGARRKKKPVIFRPAPGLMPPAWNKKEEILPDWNERWGASDPSEFNIAVKGNFRAKQWFMRTQSDSELLKFYNTYGGFESNRKKFVTPEIGKQPWIPTTEPGARHRPKWKGDQTEPRTIPVLSTDSLMLLNMPGAHRHNVWKGAKGDAVPWREETPRSMKKIKKEPGSLLLRTPGLPPAWLAVGRANPAEAVLLTYEGSMSEARLRNGPTGGRELEKALAASR